jgi:hypothetical protein
MEQNRIIHPDIDLSTPLSIIQPSDTQTQAIKIKKIPNCFRSLCGILVDGSPVWSQVWLGKVSG